ncbi:hypothetical protein Tco_0213532 [Tanacetum coccineum]
MLGIDSRPRTPVSLHFYIQRLPWTPAYNLLYHHHTFPHGNHHGSNFLLTTTLDTITTSSIHHTTPVITTIPLEPPPLLVCPTYTLGKRVRCPAADPKAPSTSHSPRHIFITLLIRADTPPIRAGQDPEVTLPPRKRLGIALGPRYEVGESLSAPTARPPGGFRADYGFVATIDKEIMRDLERDTKISKKQRIDVSNTKEKVGKVKEEEPVKRVGKRKKQNARKGISIDKSPQGDSETDKEESIIRANGADIVYMSFGAMLKDFTREDLIELYRLVMQKYGTNRPEDAYDRVLWSDLRTMFDPPLNEDAIWSLPLQQKMISWRYYDKCAVHCLTLEACNIYMLADRKYPLSKDACQVMLKMKLLDGKMNEVCYKLLKMIEKQAGLATPEQTATGKEKSNPLIADDLLKIICCEVLAMMFKRLDAANIRISDDFKSC